jgi:23S rRNA pseudouridine2605 synthase
MVILQKYVRDNLGISRRKAEEIIWQGLIEVNGTIAKPGVMVDPEKDIIKYKKDLITNKKKKLVYIIFNKPAGYVTTKSDPHNANTIFTLLPKKYSTLSPVGRLDKDTEGLLILTNDGDLNYRLSHPKFGIEKEYQAVISGKLKVKDKAALEKGINTPNLTTAGCVIKNVRVLKSTTSLSVIMHEGQKREIRLMFAHFGHTVLALKRVRVGIAKLEGIKVSEYKEVKYEDLYC